MNGRSGLRAIVPSGRRSQRLRMASTGRPAPRALARSSRGYSPSPRQMAFSSGRSRRVSSGCTVAWAPPAMTNAGQGFISRSTLCT